MAKVTVKITSKKRDEFESTIINEITNRWSRRRKDIQGEVVREIESVVEANSDRFQPHRSTLGGLDVVGKLGVGIDGSPDFTKLRGAYKLLIPTRSSTISKASISFQKRASRFGRVQFTIDIDKFLNAELTNYTSFSGGVAVKVPWMRHFIFGVETPDHAFIDDSDPSFSEEVSRTGLGHMVRLDSRQGVNARGRVSIPRQQFSFPGVGLAPTFDTLLRRVVKRLQRTAFVKRIEEILAKG